MRSLRGVETLETQEDFPDTQKVQKDAMDDQKTPETQDNYEEPPGSHPSTNSSLIRHAC